MMKLIFCCLILIANISDNGNASLESFAPTNGKVLFEDSTKNFDKCNRPCKFNVKPKRCYFNFKIEPSIDDDSEAKLTINGISPGPPINVCINDVVVVDVTNKIPDNFISIHWHGVEQKGTPYMDGVPMVTQCPIGYGSTYKYAFIASSPGTYFYHSDSVYQQSDGVYGSLIVNQPQPLEPHASLYDFDKSEEHTLLVAAKFPKLLTGNFEDLEALKPTTLSINGDEESVKLFVMPGYAYRLRLINTIAIDCPIIANIDKHEMLIISADGKPVKPALAKNVQLYPGERMDVVVRAAQKRGGYWFTVSGSGACADLEAKVMLLYVGFNYTSMLMDDPTEQPSKQNMDSEIVVSGEMLQSLQTVSETPESRVRKVYLGINRNKAEKKGSDHDFRYISDAIPKKPFYPAPFYLTDQGVVQINRKNFLFPNTPILLKPKEVRKDMICKVGEENRHKEPQCIQLLDALEGEVLEIALVNEGSNSNDSYTFHMHGFTMEVVAVWQDPKSQPLTRSRFITLEQQGVIYRNLRNPPSKDTVVVPNKGYTIVRIRPDRGGSWLLECRSCSLSSLPVAVIINVPQIIPKAVIDTIPMCGSFRPPDVLLN